MSSAIVKPKNRLPNYSKLMFVVGWLATIGFWFILRLTALTNPIAMTGFDMAKSLVQNLPALIQFIGKIMFPFNLSVLPLIRDTGFGYGITATVK